MSGGKNTIQYRILAVFLAAMVFVLAVVSSRSIVLADEAVVLEPQETESLTAEQNLNQNDEALQIDSIEEVSSSDITDSVLESADSSVYSSHTGAETVSLSPLIWTMYMKEWNYLIKMDMFHQ
ncbi:MAG: hypothetical protein LUH20_13730 [Lachnospiraceae bacterium]|nr:hypothetical protein [Lachnospiraceae bacterium]